MSVLTSSIACSHPWGDTSTQVLTITVGASVTEPSPWYGEVNVPINPILQWNSITAATSYSLQVSSTSDFISPILAITFPADKYVSSNNIISYPWPGVSLDNNSSYYWRVCVNYESSLLGSYSSGWMTSLFSTKLTGGYSNVIYDGNGSSLGIAPIDAHNAYPKGSTVTVMENIGFLSFMPMSKQGYVFQGWADSPSATTATYAPGDTFIIYSDITLYAVWEEDPDYSATTATVPEETSFIDVFICSDWEETPDYNIQ